MLKDEKLKRTPAWWVARIGALLSTLLLVGYIGIAFIVANNITVPAREALIGNPQSEVGLDYQDITFPAREDVVSISAWFIPYEGSNRAIIFVHGKDQNRTLEFTTKSLQMVKGLHDNGFNIFMLDIRGHGESAESRFTYGIRERRDVWGAVDWLQNEQGFTDGSIGVLGVSMGAATSIGATAEEPAIGALVTDSSYAVFMDVVDHAFTSESGLPHFFLPAAMLAIQVLVGEDVTTSRPVDEIGSIAPRPVLIIHAKGDSLIFVDHAKRLKAALPSAELWIMDAEEHAKTYNYDPEGYVERVSEFFDASLENK